MEQYFQEGIPQSDLNKEDGSSMENWKSFSAADKRSDDDRHGGFDCNICLDSVQDPVVTFCGHIYCWPCIYKWLHIQNISSTENPEKKHPQCPVCKAEISETTLIPLYGRGQTKKPSNTKGQGIVMPRRPSGPACWTDAPPMIPSTTGNLRASQQLYYRNHRNHPHPSSYASSPMFNTTTSTYPIMGMFGEMVSARVFGNSVANTYAYPNSYHLAGSTTARMRRQEMHADKSLSRICFFLFCCIVLCLLLF